MSGTAWAVGVTGVVALGLVLLPVMRPQTPDFPLVLFAIPIALCAVRLGVRGGLAAAVLGVGIGVFWFVNDQRFASGVPDLVVQLVVFLLVGGVVGAVVDSRRVLERALANHEELSLDLICTASFDGYFTRVNPAGEELLGYRSDELVARPFLDFVHPDDREATVAEMKRQTEEGLAVFNFKNRYRRKDGAYIWLEWSSRPDHQGENLIAVARDISERVAAEDVVANYRAELEQAVRDRTAELEQRSRDLEDSRLETLRRLALAAEYHDQNTFEHTERVGQMAFLLAQALGLADGEAALIRLAAPLHDVGKFGVPDSILGKPGRLTAGESLQVEQHTVAGATILAGSNSELLRIAEQIALSHHEWWNGDGYPHRLAGEQIPLPARIVALADVFDALTHTRPYKRAWPLEKAIAEIERLRGQQFDPAVVDALGRLHPDALAKLAEAGSAEPDMTEPSQAPRSPSRPRNDRGIAARRAATPLEPIGGRGIRG